MRYSERVTRWGIWTFKCTVANESEVIRSWGIWFFFFFLKGGKNKQKRKTTQDVLRYERPRRSRSCADGPSPQRWESVRDLLYRSNDSVAGASRKWPTKKPSPAMRSLSIGIQKGWDAEFERAGCLPSQKLKWERRHIRMGRGDQCEWEWGFIFLGGKLGGSLFGASITCSPREGTFSILQARLRSDLLSKKK